MSGYNFGLPGSFYKCIAQTIGDIFYLFHSLIIAERLAIAYKGIIVLLVIIGIILDNIYVERVYHNKEEDKTKLK